MEACCAYDLVVMNHPTWFVAFLLMMLAALMGVHLYSLSVGVKECDDYAQILFEQARRVAEIQNDQVKIVANNTECNSVEDDFNRAAAQYLSLILALLGGAGIAATPKAS
jgi:hypothetical protein